MLSNIWLCLLICASSMSVSVCTDVNVSAIHNVNMYCITVFQDVDIPLTVG